MRQLPLSVRLRDAARLASFVPGRNAEICSILGGPCARWPRTLWLWGRAGTGKTHLLQAACAAVGERGGAAAFFDLTQTADSAVLQGCEGLELVCLDGLDAVAADPAWNAAIFRLHTLMQDGAGRLVVSSEAPPAQVPIALADLRSRLLAASVHQLHDLDEAGQVAALQLRAARRGLELSAEAALYLLHRLPRDTASLFSMLDELDEASLAAQRRLTIPFLRAALEAGAGAQRD
ncbi:MAG TPA: DnaA regulatory inactivator Hda [Steroidobacteraceae bacterium]|nr:DnaA regulatory inactivator Hda [Steroidobacteraceae bacterium]